MPLESGLTVSKVTHSTYGESQTLSKTHLLTLSTGRGHKPPLKSSVFLHSTDGLRRQQGQWASGVRCVTGTCQTGESH